MTSTGDPAWDDARRETRAATRAARRAAQENVRANGSPETRAAFQRAIERLDAALERERLEWHRATGREP